MFDVYNTAYKSIKHIHRETLHAYYNVLVASCSISCIANEQATARLIISRVPYLSVFITPMTTITPRKGCALACLANANGPDVLLLNCSKYCLVTREWP